LVLYLCHENTDETGSLFEVGGGWIGKVRWQKSSGAVVKHASGEMTPEDVRDRWSEVTSFDKPIYHAAIGEATNHCIEACSSTEESTTESQSTEQNDKSAKYTYDFKNAILYALSLGVSTSNEKHLKFLYENHAEFSVLPGFGVIPAFATLFSDIASLKLPHDIQIDPAKILHGEHYLELYKPFSANGTLDLRSKLVDVLDKGSGATIIVNVELYDEKNEKVALNQFVTFLVGSGNFGGKRNSDLQVQVNTKKFDRKPDRTVEEKTSIDQAALYRLNGDLNPLHIDPSFSAILGFNQPILHGLCSFGIAVKHILDTYCDSDVSCFKSVKVRFAKPVVPGQTIQTNMWLEGNRVYFECKVLETNTVVINGAYADLNSVKGAAPAPVASKPETSSVSSVDFASDKIFNELTSTLNGNQSIAKSINAVYEFRITKADTTKTYVADLKQAKILFNPQNVKADCTIMIKDEDFVSLASGTGKPQQMFMSGKLKVKGNIMLAQKLEKLFKSNSKL